MPEISAALMSIEPLSSLHGGVHTFKFRGDARIDKSGADAQLNATDQGWNHFCVKFDVAAYSFCQHGFKLLALFCGHFFCGPGERPLHAAMLCIKLIEMARSARNVAGAAIRGHRGKEVRDQRRKFRIRSK